MTYFVWYAERLHIFTGSHFPGQCGHQSLFWQCTVHLLTPSVRTMAVGLTKPLMETSKMDISWGGGGKAGAWDSRFYHLHVPIV
jgi:hypothetical protein